MFFVELGILKTGLGRGGSNLLHHPSHTISSYQTFTWMAFFGPPKAPWVRTRPACYRKEAREAVLRYFTSLQPRPLKNDCSS